MLFARSDRRAAALAAGMMVAALWFACGGGAVQGETRPAPEFAAVPWLNGPPRTLASLRGEVVLVEFWTFACGNCRNVEPHVKEWHARFAPRGLHVIGIHTPELDFERDEARLRDYLAQHAIEYPIAVDRDSAIWRQFGTWAWPSLYLIDKQGRIRVERVGEGGYAEMEHAIETLLDEPAEPAATPVAAASR